MSPQHSQLRLAPPETLALEACFVVVVVVNGSAVAKLTFARARAHSRAHSPASPRACVCVFPRPHCSPAAILVPLARADLVGRFPFGAACALLVVKRLGGFDARATGPWLRDRLVLLLDDAEEMVASKL